MAQSPRNTRLRIRIVFGANSLLGPGKADMLELIQETGSIAAAGRCLGMSYKRAWMLVETLNNMFAVPLVESSRGGASHGGARITANGERVLALYRAFEAKAANVGATEINSLERLLAPASGDMSLRK